MLATDGKLPNEIAGDFCHPTEKGYQIWDDSLRPYISEHSCFTHFFKKASENPQVIGNDFLIWVLHAIFIVYFD
jgi:hypothetical protein